MPDEGSGTELTSVWSVNSVGHLTVDFLLTRKEGQRYKSWSSENRWSPVSKGLGGQLCHMSGSYLPLYGAENLMSPDFSKV